jgi:predicted dehydrogenase
MKKTQFNRRRFIKETATTAAGIVGLSAFSGKVLAAAEADSQFVNNAAQGAKYKAEPRIKFSVIGINHSHINSQVDAVLRGGGQFISFYAKEPDLAAPFAKKFPQAKQAGSEKEILEDKSIQLILSSTISNERAPLGIRVMQHGKDFMSDKPGITTLQQLA